MTIQTLLEEKAHSAIRVTPAGEAEQQIGATRLGGRPDVPAGFSWPVFHGRDASDEPYSVPLTFLGQFNCADLAPLDLEHLLPTHGVLSFFYEAGRQPWGFKPEDKGSGRVFWFPEAGCLAPAEPPAALPQKLQFPACGVSFRQIPTVPDWEDLSLPMKDWEVYLQAIAAWPVPKEEGIQLLGWPVAIQGAMQPEVDLLAQGYDTGRGYRDLPKKVVAEAKAMGPERWQLLLQFAPPAAWTELMFGDCGQIYFWISKEDLAARRWDNVWVMLQCC